MQEDLIVAADFGTTGVKMGVVDREFRLVAIAAETYPTRISGVVAEQEPNEWWSAATRAVRRLAAEVPMLRERTAALAVCAQMCGLVLCDEKGNSLRPCLIWVDKRAAEEARELVGGAPAYRGYNWFKLARWLKVANGAPALNGADVPAKARWVRKREPETWKQTSKILDVKDWLLFRATGRMSTTADCANLTWMFDSRPETHGWSDKLMQMCDVSRDRLPDIVDGSEVVGGLTAVAADELGLRENLPVVGGSGDVCSAALGSGAVADRALHIHVGTSSWIAGFFPERRLSVMHSYATIASAVGYHPLLIATQESAGACLAWGATALTVDKRPESLIAMAATSGPPAASDPMFLPWMAGERMPIDNERLRGGFLGLSLDCSREKLAQSILEGIALNLAWSLRILRRAEAPLQAPTPVIGTVATSEWFMRLLANVLQEPLEMLNDAGTASLLGISTFAATALRWSASPKEAAAGLHRDKRLIRPDQALAHHYGDRLARFEKAARLAVKWHGR